jgi:hypothetical protein
VAKREVEQDGHPRTPDGRYFVVRGRLWRSTDPSLAEGERKRLVSDLMTARRAVRDAGSSGDLEALASARRAVDRAKRALGERGPVWWSDGSPDYNRYLARNTPYAAWFEGLSEPSPAAAGT